MKELKLLFDSLNTVTNLNLLRRIYRAQVKRKKWSKDELIEIVNVCKKRKAEIQ